MAKLLQNRIAESSFLLPLMAVVALGVWFACGLVAHGWWSQLVCFVTTTYLMVELSNSNALLRVRSRMVSSTFLSLSCASCFLLGELQGGIVQLCAVAAIIILFHCYQDEQSPGWTFYAFLCLSLATMAFVQLFFFVPVVWLLMVTQLQSLSWRTWAASLLGLLTPYWLALPYFVYIQDFSLPLAHFAPLSRFPFPYDYATLGIGKVVTYAFVVVMTLTAIVHCWLRSFEDKIRIRQLYGFFTTMSLLLMVFIALQPQHYDTLMRLLVVMASPLIAHFLTLTSSKPTNIVFVASAVLALLLTAFHLLSPYLAPWIGS